MYTYQLVHTILTQLAPYVYPNHLPPSHHVTMQTDCQPTPSSSISKSEAILTWAINTGDKCIYYDNQALAAALDDQGPRRRKGEDVCRLCMSECGRLAEIVDFAMFTDRGAKRVRLDDTARIAHTSDSESRRQNNTSPPILQPRPSVQTLTVPSSTIPQCPPSREHSPSPTETGNACDGISICSNRTGISRSASERLQDIQDTLIGEPTPASKR